MICHDACFKKTTGAFASDSKRGLDHIRNSLGSQNLLMSSTYRNVAVLGSTGSIGTSTLEVIRGTGDRFRAIALSGHRNLDLLSEQAKEFQPRWVVVSDLDKGSVDSSQRFGATELLYGARGLEAVAAAPEVDVVVAAIVGSAGLPSTWAALEAGKTVALANKETLVMAGPLVTELAQKTGGKLLPVDSEHSAVFQALQSGKRSEVKRIVLTASGGPFRTRPKNEMKNITIEDALAHPTWQMGPKITVDSATMMNKALEIIEARWLFDLRADQIDVVVHPQSIVHSMVEYADGSVLAQLSPPDMKLPIQYALTYPERCGGPAERLDLSQAIRMEFEPPDLEKFPALTLGHRAAADGGTAGAVLNAANEAAVQQFLDGQIAFEAIVTACREVLENHEFDPTPSLEQLIALDQWARKEILKWIGV